MIQRTAPLLLALALLCLPACSSSEGSSAARTSAPTARSTGTTDPGSRFLRSTGAVGAIAVESSPLEGRYVSVPPSRSLPTARPGPRPAPPTTNGSLPPPNVYAIPEAPRLPVTER